VTVYGGHPGVRVETTDIAILGAGVLATQLENTMYTYKARVTAVYDGDTITCDIDLGFGVWLRDQTIRLFGIDTPELRGDEKTEGKVSRDVVREMILDKEVTLRTVKDTKGKYGRWLADVYNSDKLCVNEYLIANGYARRYMP
jgi:micrococcal nuclease